MKTGDRLILQSAGGGGYGDPLSRETDRVMADLRSGFISETLARKIYGVILTSGGELDESATARVRKKMILSRMELKVVASSANFYATVGSSKKRICIINSEKADQLGLANDDRVELLGPSGAPLRAWLVLDDKINKGELPLDSLGLKVLGAEINSKVWIRPLYVPGVT